MNELRTLALQAALEVMTAYDESPESVDAQTVEAAVQVLRLASSHDESGAPEAERMAKAAA